MRAISYVDAIREAHAQLLATDDRVFVFGQGLWSPWYVGASMKDLDKEFGRERIIDSPVSENATTGAAIGAALCGMRPIVVHPRMDFMVLAMDPIVNQAANWSYMFAGEQSCPVVIRPIINRGGEQAAQHSQALQSWFFHVPGVKIVMPSTAYDAKGLLVSATRDDDPVVYIDDRWLYEETDPTPEEIYEVPIGEGAIRREGIDVTIVGYSYTAAQSVKAAAMLSERGIDAEVVDLRTVKPWDKELVLESVRKTGRCVVTDSGWMTGGVAAEIAAVVGTEAFESLVAPIQRVALPDLPAPMAAPLEKAYYDHIGVEEIASVVEKTIAVKERI